MKHTKKKRILALVLCMVLVLSTGIAAFANDDVGLQSVACSATNLERVIKNADGEQIGKLVADVPEGAFYGSSSEANIQMDVQVDSGEEAVLKRVQSQMEAEGLSGYEIGNCVMTDVTFYVNGVKQTPQQPITFHLTGTSLDTEKAMAFADDRQNAPTLMDATTEESDGLQFVANASGAETIVYGVFEKTEEVAYEQTYSDDQVEIKVSAANGVLPSDAQLSVTPIVKTDITNAMSEEEKQTAEEVNAKYDTTEQKLNEKATDESYGIAGFLAYDITFTDSNGNKIEPTGDVNVSMNYKKAAIPEEAQKTIEEQSEDTAVDVTVMHLKENAQGEVEKVVDMVADENETASVETTDTKDVQKAEFVSDSFSVYTITWSYSGDNKASFTAEQSLSVDLVDRNGATVGSEKSKTVEGGTYSSKSSKGETTYSVTGETITASDVAPEIDGYTYKKCVVGQSVANGVGASYLRCEATGTKKNDRNKKIGINSYTWKYSTDGSIWTEVGINKVYFVYKKDTALKIEDNIISDGTIEAVYKLDGATEDKIKDESVVEVVWYSSETAKGCYQEDTNGTYKGSWTEVEKVNYVGEKSNLSGDKNEKLYPSYDMASDKDVRKWYQAKITLSDGTEVWSEPYQIPYYGKLENGSFEKPVGNKQWTNDEYVTNEGVWQSTGVNKDKENVAIEIVAPLGNTDGWKGYSWIENDWTTTEDGKTITQAPKDGNQFAELNCEAAGALYQDVLTMPGQTLNYQLSHRARGDNANTTQYDTMFLVIAPSKDVADITSQSDLEKFVNEKVSGVASSGATDKEENEEVYNKDGVMIVRITSDNQNWHTVTGSNYVPTSGLTRFFFMSGTTYYGRNHKEEGKEVQTIGNFLDAVSFSQDIPEVSDDEFSIELNKKFSGLSTDQITGLQSTINFKIKVKKDGKSLTDDEIDALMGTTKAAISGSQMTMQPDGSLRYSILSKKIDKNDTYTVTITEEKADLSGYTLSTSVVSKVTETDKEDTTADSGTFELKGKTITYVTFTNSYEGANQKNINFTKEWDDNDNKYNTRPSSLNVTLKASYTIYNGETGAYEKKELSQNELEAAGFKDNVAKTLTSNDGWKCSWSVPVYLNVTEGSKVKIDYTVEEGSVESDYVYTSPSDGKAVEAKSSTETGYKSSTDWKDVVSYNTTTSGSTSTASNDSKISTTSVNSETDTTSTSVFGKLKSKIKSLFTGANVASVNVVSEDSGSGASESTLGEPDHHKYITYNQSTNDYTLNLDVTGAEGSTNGVDVLFVIDTSGSMGSGRDTSTYCNLLPTVKTLLNGSNSSTGIVDQILNANSKNSVAFVSFAGKDQTKTTDWYTSANSLVFKNKINNLKAEGGTNWTYAMQKADEVLGKKASDNNKKVVIFLSDGQPTFTITNGNETGWGSRTEERYYTDAIKVVADSTNLREVDGFYSVYLTSGTKSGMQKFSDGIKTGEVSAAECKDGSDGKLSETLSGIMNQVIPKYNDVVITDVLSNYVDFVDTNTSAITVTKKNASGDVTTLVSDTDYTASINSSTKSVKVSIEGELETGATYTASFKVKPSDDANAYYANEGDYPDNMEGDAGTGSTSAGKKGFYSNNSNSTKLSYKITGDDTEKSANYQKPVIQVLTHTLTYRKQWNQPENVEMPKNSITLDVAYTDGTAGTVTLEADGYWAYTETVPVTRNISNVTEQSVPSDYTASYIIDSSGTTATVINNYSKLEKKDITVTKKWSGDDNNKDARTSVTVGLYRKEAGSTGTAVRVDSQTLSDENKWTYTWTQQEIEKYDGADTSVSYEYGIQEENIPAGYQSSISYDFDRSNEIAVTITNTYDTNCADENYYIANVLQTEKLNVEKEWEDNENTLGLRPEKLNVTVNGLTFSLDNNNKWTSSKVVPRLKTVDGNTNLNVSENLSEVDTGKNYSQNGAPVVIRTNSETDVTVKNKLDSKSITVTKVWNDRLADVVKNEGETTVNHDYANFKLQYRENSSAKWKDYRETPYRITKDGNESEEWTYKIDNLPVSYQYQVVETGYAVGNKVYTLEKGNYVVTYDQGSTSANTYTITNTLKWSAIKMSQDWNKDAPGAGDVGLEGAKFNLKQSGTLIATGVSKSDGTIDWTPETNATTSKTYDLTALNGDYTVEETKAPAGYMKDSTGWTLTFENGLLTKQNGKSVTGTVDKGVVMKLGNKKLYSLPSTGGKGIFLFTIGGMLLMGGAAWIMYRSKRKELLRK